MEYLGHHILAEFYNCSPGVLNDIHFLEKVMIHSTKLAGATLVGSHFHPYSPIGISGVVVIKESHFAIHTWPEHAYAAVDFFTCSKDFQFEEAYHYLVKKFEAGKHFYQEIKRGEVKTAHDFMNQQKINKLHTT